MDEAALHELLSGRRPDLCAKLLRAALRFASWGYGSAVQLRNFGYDIGLLPVHQAGVPVISIGNITTGGTGKTPFAAWLANWLTAAGYKPGLLSRGYRSLESGSKGDATASSGNDEKLVLDRLCPNVPHLQQRDRVASARRAVNEVGCEVLLLDDGFQHRRLARSLDLVLVDSILPWGYGKLLPRGLLREPLSGLKRADLVILTRVDQCTNEQRQSLRAELRKIRGRDECVEVAFIPQHLVDQHWQPQPLDSVTGKKVLAFCGIGNPEGFRRTITSLGSSSVTVQSFPDHHHYTERDFNALANQAQSLGAELVLTTQKDFVKIAPPAWHGPPLFVVEIGLEFMSGLELLETHLRRAIPTESTPQ